MQQKTETGKPAPNMIKLAVTAGGGANTVAEACSVTHWAVREWIRSGRVPAQHIRKLCDLGGVITPDQILAYIEANAERACA